MKNTKPRKKKQDPLVDESNEFRRLGDHELRREKRSMNVMIGFMLLMSIVPPILIVYMNPQEQPVYAICWLATGILACLMMPVRRRIRLNHIGKRITETPEIETDDPDGERTLSLPPVRGRFR